MKSSQRPNKKTDPAPAATPTPAPVGFKYPDSVEYDRACQVLAGEGDTMKDYLIACIKSKASEHGKAPSKMTETAIAKLPGMPSRMTLYSMRTRGALDGLFEQKGQRVLYDVKKTTQFFAANTASNPSPKAQVDAR